MKCKKGSGSLWNQAEVNKAIGNFEGIVTAKSNIALARSMYEGGVNHEELIKASQELYELLVVEFGQENGYSIDAGKTLAIQLQNANRGEEARDFFVKLLAISSKYLVLITIKPYN
jgi:copper chaperone CopZ